jgi:cysteinyl-tRNA synthetase
MLNTLQILGGDILGILDIDEKTDYDEELLNELIKIIIDIRNDARKEKRFDVSDKIRDELKKLNIELEDKRGQTTWKLHRS